ncbi:MAG TPA: FecR domain-containing protein [Rhizomicrobium sp.]|nr:FecR domain-containing protein [Rhizomicrobium sp.]
MSQFRERFENAPYSDIDMRAANYVERRDASGWTDRDEAELDAWLSEAVAHRITFIRLNSSWKRTERLVALRTPEHLPDAPRGPGGGRNYVRVAAVFGLLLGAGGFLAIYLNTPRIETYSTPVGGREILTLRDGSRVELNTDTSIRVSLSAQERAITVERGEVYFQVHHDASRPFVVTAQGHHLIDLGTEFSLRVDPQHVKVALLAGRVRFDPDTQTSAKAEVLTPGDVLMASADRVSVKKESLHDLLASLAWRQGMLVFHNTALADAAAEFNRYNQTKIVIQDPLAAKEAINGTLPINNLAEFSRMAKNLFGLRAENREDEILLTR